MKTLLETRRNPHLAHVIFSGLPRIAVLGLGRAGTVTAACLASAGHRVHAVDRDPARVSTLNAGRSPVDETGLYAIIGKERARDRLIAGTSVVDAVTHADLSIISLDLPLAADGSDDLAPLAYVADAIGRGIAEHDGYHVVVMRTPVPPGTTMAHVIPRIEAASGLVLGRDFGAAFVPAFLRPGRAISDFRQPAKTIIGAWDARSANLVARVFEVFGPAPTRTSLTAAEMTMHVDAVRHPAPRVVPSRTVATPSERWRIPSREALELSGPGSSTSTIQPGDIETVRAVHRHPACDEDELPLQASAMASAEFHLTRTVALARASRPRRVGILGLPIHTSAAGDSPVLHLIASLIEAGVEVAIYDDEVSSAVPFFDALATLRHSSQCLRSLAFLLDRMLRPTPEAAAEDADVLVIARDRATFDAIADQTSGAMTIRAVWLDICAQTSGEDA